MLGLVGPRLSSPAVRVEACLKAEQTEIYAFLFSISLLTLVSFDI